MGYWFAQSARAKAELSLKGTKLVTLSACETGLGVSQSGEGVLGLRRGFQIAGVQNILMTLWPVADDSTVGFMKTFYGDLEKGITPGHAVWKNQRELIRSQGELRKAVFTVGGYQLVGRGR